ncbi:MAG: hypothetical protein H6Q90_41 [Deltaproteobacteria bacterium]|nr:hypothetical protein [Deltaproteobacteria bacterium]
MTEMSKRAIMILAVVFGFGVLSFAARTASAGSCGSDSDCAGYGKCSSGQCGACGSDSDCHGHGKCSSGKCGACGSDSDCKVGTCSGGKCGSCGSDSDCRGNGRCSSGKCGSCGSDSDCKVGKCSSSKCGACGSDSDCKGGRCSGGRCSNAAFAGFDLDDEPELCDSSGTGILALQKKAPLWCPVKPTNAVQVTAGFEALAIRLVRAN